MNPKHLKLLKTAQSLERSGKAQAAADAYKNVLVLEPRRADTWSDFAGQLIQLDQLDQAQKACETALGLEPQHLSAQINLGCILMRRERWAESERQFRTALAADAGRMDAVLCLAECLLNKNDLAQAGIVLEETLRPKAMAGTYTLLKSRQSQLWSILGLALLEIQNFEAATHAFDMALRIDSQNLLAKANLGSVLMAQGRLDEAERVLRRHLVEHPMDANGRLLLISCLGRKGELDLADQEIARVLLQEPEDFIVHKSLTGTYYTLGHWAKYRAEIARYRKLMPTFAYLDFEESQVDLMFGDMPGGWGRYEARLKIPKLLRLKQRAFEQPAWGGESFPGKTLLIWCEQGFGDSLMFMRYLPMVKALGGRVLLEAQPELADVAATCPGVDLVIPKGVRPPPFDLQASVMSLPWIFRTELATIPGEVPYLDVPAVVPNQQAILECLAVAQGSTRIGLVWAGSPGHGRDYERSLPSAALAPLADLPGVSWFSFQLGKQENPPLPNLTSLAPLLKNFSDTAYALSGMDLLITVDTSIAHLAGALGVPALLLLSFQPDFRWLLERDDSPWYPTLRLYRQPTYGDWGTVIQRMVEDLTQGA